jgi:hypothetical protein
MWSPSRYADDPLRREEAAARIRGPRRLNRPRPRSAPSVESGRLYLDHLLSLLPVVSVYLGSGDRRSVDPHPGRPPRGGAVTNNDGDVTISDRDRRPGMDHQSSWGHDLAARTFRPAFFDVFVSQERPKARSTRTKCSSRVPEIGAGEQPSCRWQPPERSHRVIAGSRRRDRIGPTFSWRTGRADRFR